LGPTVGGEQCDVATYNFPDNDQLGHYAKSKVVALVRAFKSSQTRADVIESTPAKKGYTLPNGESSLKGARSVKSNAAWLRDATQKKKKKKKKKRKKKQNTPHRRATPNCTSIILHSLPFNVG
jgi:hypothetical protein